MRKRNSLLPLPLLILVMILAACEPVSLATISTKPGETATAPIATRTPARVMTATPVLTKTSTPTPTETAPPDWGQMAIDNRAIIEKLNNLPDCKLPCWWGITPGETAWEQAEILLRDLKKRVVFWPQENKEPLIIISISRFDEYGSLYVLDVKMSQKNGVIQDIETRGDLDKESGDIRQFLLGNGKPDEIWIHSLENNLGGPPPFGIWMIYWEKGFAAEFYNSEESGKYGFDGLIHACIDRGPILYLWSDQISSLSELDTIFSKGFDMPDYMGFTAPHYRLLPVDEAIGISLDEFYTKFTVGTEQPCFVTDPDLWPEP